jgi:hypothetical protein
MAMAADPTAAARSCLDPPVKTPSPGGPLARQPSIPNLSRFAP